ncbi:hypothetical protein ALC56_07148 [Trachymyrmex septentrionalis]|uniref:Uncharacterized protein n=1 Tax=Trachymyrmex septentrionalis TaxID=34720 RepID=A0A151JW25_9HYME|nr:hypothetical protein ALC56_07148 [Trachymyrmex septentrionalis]
MSDETVGEIRRHGPLLLNTIRCIICGWINCGKTNALISLIESPHSIRFENVYVTNYSPASSMEQINKKETIKCHARFVHNSFHTNRITTTTTTTTSYDFNAVILTSECLLEILSIIEELHEARLIIN